MDGRGGQGVSLPLHVSAAPEQETSQAFGRGLQRHDLPPPGTRHAATTSAQRSEDDPQVWATEKQKFSSVGPFPL